MENMNDVSRDLADNLTLKLAHLNRTDEQKAEQLINELRGLIDFAEIHGPDDLCDPITEVAVQPRAKPWDGVQLSFRLEEKEEVFANLPQPVARKLHKDLGEILGEQNT